MANICGLPTAMRIELNYQADSLDDDAICQANVAYLGKGMPYLQRRTVSERVNSSKINADNAIFIDPLEMTIARARQSPVANSVGSIGLISE